MRFNASGTWREIGIGLAAFAACYAACAAVVLMMDGRGSPRPGAVESAAHRSYEAGLYPARPGIPGMVVPGRIERVKDGDTLVVDVSLRMSVRIVGVRAPEMRGPDREAAIVARGRLEQAIGGRQECLVGIRGDRGSTIGDATSLGRVLGEVWVGDDKESLNRKMIAAGYGE